VKDAMLAVDRACFAPHSPYVDSPQPIGSGATISAPHMHAYALDILSDNLKEGNRVLDVGSGSGYLLACFAKMVGQSGRAIGIEHIEDLVKKSIENINKWNQSMLSTGNIKIIGS
jgi:protein-L-isoaspartate(D-aspartate) O-methyltransferase